MTVGIPEIVLVLLLIGLPVWLARRFPISEKVFPNYMVIAVAVLFLVFLYNWTTTFRAAN
jgi:hypothetical protein